MDFRTDLALERREMIGEKIPRGVKFDEIISGNTKTTVIDIFDENGEKALGKPKGRYITVEFEHQLPGTDAETEELKDFSDRLSEMLSTDGLVLVAGLGNESITPDALGPETVKRIFATRHISENGVSLGLPELRQVAAISTGVLGQTGMEAGEVLFAVCEKIKPSAVIVIDALAAGNVKRLGSTVQLSDTGICPGSGVGNSRKRIDRETLGVPVISIGVPTVVDALTLISSYCQENVKREENEPMIVTPRDIDSLILSMSKFLSAGINLALQKNLTLSDILCLV